MRQDDEDWDWASELLPGIPMTRRKIQPSYVTTTGKIGTSKAARAQEFESQLEEAFLCFLDLDPTVERFATQMVCIEWIDSMGCKRKYTPDVLVRFTRDALEANKGLRHTLYEVKPAAIIKRDWAKLKPKWKAAIRFCKRFGLHFRILTETRIGATKLSNIQFLRRYRCEFLLKHELERTAAEKQVILERALAELVEATPQTLLEYITGDPQYQAELIPWMWQLINAREFGIDWNQPLTMACRIWSIPAKKIQESR